MKEYSIVGIAGSPSSGSLSSKIVDHVLTDIPESRSTHMIRLTDIPAECLVHGNEADPSFAWASKVIAEADGVVIGTPIYKASMSGLLKSFLDQLPQYGLARKIVLPIATGGSLAHTLALDYGIRPILQSMGARHVMPSVYFTSEEFAMAEGLGMSSTLGNNTRYREVLCEFILALRSGGSEEHFFLSEEEPRLGHAVVGGAR